MNNITTQATKRRHSLVPRTNRRSKVRRRRARLEVLEQRRLLAADISYASEPHVFSIDDVIGDFAGATFADDALIIDTEATFEDPANPDPPDYDGPVRAIRDKDGTALYPIDSTFGFHVEDFVAGTPKDRDLIYTEGFAGNVFDEGGAHIGLALSNAPTDTFKAALPLGRWAAGLGGNTVKAETEHYVVMQNILSDQEFPDDPDAVFALDNELIILGGPRDGDLVEDVIADLQEAYDGGDTSVDIFPAPDGDGMIDIRDVLLPNENTVTEDIAYSDNYSVTLKDDGKLLYRWGTIVKKPNDIRFSARLDVPEEWKTPEAALLNEGRGYRVTSAELIVSHTITNNPNDQIRAEDLENEGATGRKPSFVVIEHPDHPGDPEYARWAATVNDFAGDGTYYPSYFKLDADGEIITEPEAGDVVALAPDGTPVGVVNTDEFGTPVGTVFREISPTNDATSVLLSSDLTGGFTNAWYTSMDRDPFEPVLDEEGGYIVGPRWRLQAGKFGQDLPGVDIPLIPGSQPPFQKDNLKYDVGVDTVTTINVLDWAVGEESPLLYSNGWTMPIQPVDEFDVTSEGLQLTDDLDVAFYIKGDIKPARVYDVRLELTYEGDARQFVVNSTGDLGDADLSDGVAEDIHGDTTLRAAIEQANFLTDGGLPDEILFDIPDAGPHAIVLSAALPAITDRVVIDATSEPDYGGTPVVQVDGGGFFSNGLLVNAGDTTISGLSLTGFSEAGIHLSGAGENTLSENYIGVDVAGLAAPNDFGIRVEGSADNVIDGNLISGNDRSAVFISGAGSNNNLLINNQIGTDADGLAAIPNGEDGVTIFSPGNQIGLPGQGNLISGNMKAGIHTSFADNGSNVIQANHVGVDATGLVPLPNTTGISLENESNQVGGALAGEGNVISGNLHGLIISGAIATGNVVQGNTIGTDVGGTVDIGDTLYGVGIINSSGNTIGGLGAGEGNLISGNDSNGVIIAKAGATNNLVIGNQIGTDVSGDVALPNLGDGVRIAQQASHNRIEANHIAGNAMRGVAVLGPGATGNEIVDNLIGVDSTEIAPLHNGTGGAVKITSPNTLVQGNVVSAVDVAIVAYTASAKGTIIEDNFIGTDRAESGVLLGTPDGIHLVTAASDSLISGNVIANTDRAIILTNTGEGNRITSNSIYDNTGIGIDLNADGVTPNDAGDVDEGENRLQNTPVISSASVVNVDDIEITYLVDTLPASATFDLRIEFFASDDGQARILLGTDDYTEADQSTGDKTITLTGVASLLTAGDQLTATATDADGNTSEISLEVALTT